MNPLTHNLFLNHLKIIYPLKKRKRKNILKNIKGGPRGTDVLPTCASLAMLAGRKSTTSLRADPTVSPRVSIAVSGLNNGHASNLRKSFIHGLETTSAKDKDLFCLGLDFLTNT